MRVMIVAEPGTLRMLSYEGFTNETCVFLIGFFLSESFLVFFLNNVSSYNI
jgi:hypothetical protein